MVIYMQSAAGWSPVYVEDNLGVMSIGFMLPNPDDAIIWRGPKKNGKPRLHPPFSFHLVNDAHVSPHDDDASGSLGLIKQFLTDVDWGELDFLIIDSKS